MFLTALLMMVQVQQPATPASPATPSPVATLTSTPASATLAPGDTLRLVAVATDSAGKPVESARIRFNGAGGRFEGKVDSTGLVSAGSTGTINVVAVAMVPGAKPFVQRMEVKIVAGPAAKLAIATGPEKLVTGQTIRLSATTWSVDGDQRDDRAVWKSSNPAVLKVQPTGALT